MNLSPIKFNSAKKLWQFISKERRRQFILVLFLMLLTSVAEAISIGAVIPFLGVLTSPDRVFENESLLPFFSYFNITNPNQITLPITISFCFLALLSGGLRLFLLRKNTALSYDTGADISSEIYRKTLYQSYTVHISRNSSEIIDGISTKTNITTNYINAILNSITSAVLLIAIIATLILINPFIALFTLIIFGLLYFQSIKIVRKKININSQIIANHSTQILKILKEGLGGIRDIIISGSQEVFCEIYKNADLPLRKASSNNQIVSAAPRFIMESLGITLIALLSYFLIQQKNDQSFNAVPILGGIALGAQRLLPALQQLYSSWVTIKASQASLLEVIRLLDQQLPPHIGVHNINSSAMPFLNSFKLIGVGFRYPNSLSDAITNINIEIKRGIRLGIVGPSGCGKSTLVDLIMGLLAPTSGHILVDGITTVDNNNAHLWQRNIAHVPQSIYLTDANVIENVAFGVPPKDVNLGLVYESIRKAQLSSVIDKLPNKYLTKLGESGINLSGGQRQRIAIARALYKNSKIIIFDEATSALDINTEYSIMESIKNLSQDITVIIITHRISTLSGCDEIINLERNK